MSHREEGSEEPSQLWKGVVLVVLRYLQLVAAVGVDLLAAHQQEMREDDPVGVVQHHSLEVEALLVLSHLVVGLCLGAVASHQHPSPAEAVGAEQALPRLLASVLAVEVSQSRLKMTAV